MADAAGIFRVTEEPLELAPLIEAVSAPAHGAVVCFLGMVRDASGERAVTHLAYTAYPAMAETKMAEIGAEIQERFGPLALTAVHRVGELPVGTASLALAVGAPHRREAYAAARYFVDRLKETVPVWKEDLTRKESQG